MPKGNDIALVFDGDRWWVKDAREEARALPPTQEGLLPGHLPETGVRLVLLPLEAMLLRPFQLPLARPSLLDDALLAQELADMTGEPADAWWLCWSAWSVADGVEGLCMGMPVAWQREMRAARALRATPVVTADGVARLSSWLPTARQGVAAIVDQDAEGVFLGVANAWGWAGLRRLNAAMDTVDQALAEEVRLTLRAMGWSDDAPVFGRLGARLFDLLACDDWQGQHCADDALPDRLSATFVAAAEINNTPLNFRRAHWRPNSLAFDWRQWRRPAVLAGALMLAWLGAETVVWWQLQAEMREQQARIMKAFRQALPHDPVIDPLAQLQRAAGSNSGGAAQTSVVLRELAALARVHARQPWRVQSLTFTAGRVEMRGEIDGLKGLNTLQKQLQQALQREVRIVDTELGKNTVRFRMEWS
ncbi:MAG: hypothetical protein D6678_04470 [Zetaproteobacteria bacterium]|nr:MAG: hypothetical protein D6678_04470 [Zetaproteobacteria bacterium]